MSAPRTPPLVSTPQPDRHADLEANRELLDAELPDRRFVDTRYLRWLYEQNPAGPAYEASIDDELGRRIAHYALVSQQYRDAEGPHRCVFSLNAVTRSGIQRRGLFQQTAATVYAAAAADGVEMVVGVSNANSTPPAVRRLGWRLLGPLPVSMSAASWRGRDVWSATVTPALVSSDRFASTTARLDTQPARAWTASWKPDTLAWRLQPPNAAPYAIHTDDDVLAVSTLDSFGPVPVAVILKLLPLRRLDPGDDPIDAAAVLAAACRFHRAPSAVYAGWNRWVSTGARRIPTRLRPVPLNFIVRSLTGAIDQDRVSFDCFEFLDADAY